MLEARVQIDTKSLEQDLDDVQRKQLPFATLLQSTGRRSASRPRKRRK